MRMRSSTIRGFLGEYKGIHDKPVSSLQVSQGARIGAAREHKTQDRCRGWLQLEVRTDRCNI